MIVDDARAERLERERARGGEPEPRELRPRERRGERAERRALPSERGASAVSTAGQRPAGDLGRRVD